MGCSRQEVRGGWAIPPNYCYRSNHSLARHVHRQDIPGMQPITSLENITHVHLLAMPTTHTCADRHASALMPNFRYCSSLTRTFYDHIYPNRGPKVAAGCTPVAYREHCKRVFALPAAALPEIISNPDPSLLPFSSDCIHQVLDTTYKGNKSSGPSLVPTQMIKHLHSRNNSSLSRLFHRIAREGTPPSCNTAKLTPVYKKATKQSQQTTNQSVY